MEDLGFGILAVCSIIFIVSGWILYGFPPQKRNVFYGYRTMSSMATEETWKFSQKYAALRMIESGVFLIVISAVEYYVDFSDNEITAINVIALLGSIFYMIFRTEKALKIKFPTQS